MIIAYYATLILISMGGGVPLPKIGAINYNAAHIGLPDKGQIED